MDAGLAKKAGWKEFAGCKRLEAKSPYLQIRVLKKLNKRYLKHNCDNKQFREGC
jgi:hypothetical protein